MTAAPRPCHHATMSPPSFAELRGLIARHGSADAAPLRALPDVRLMTIAAPTRPFAHVSEPILALVAQGKKRIGLGGRTIECRAGQSMIVPVDLPMDAQVVEATAEAPFMSFSLRLKPEAIAGLLLESGTVGQDRNDSAGVVVCDLDDDLIEPVIRLLRLLDRPADIRVLFASIEREILWRLINGKQGALVRQIGVAGGRVTQVASAIRCIRSRFAEAIRIEELAGIAGMSVTSFHRHFRAVTSMTPIQYQKQIRLQAARARILSGMRDVAAIGFAVGYQSPAQFSREYRRQFGQPPSRDGASLRAQGQGAAAS